MAPKSKTALCSLSFFAIAFIFIIIAFVSPYWLVTDGKLANPKFIQIGLWEVCFNGFQDPRHWYDTVFSSCWWIFEEEYYIIADILLPGFFVATQFFFTLCLTFLLAGIFLVVWYWKERKDSDRYILLMLTIGSDLLLAGFSGLISVVIFGARGDGRDWMPNWEHNDLSWAFALASIGSVLLFPAGVLMLVEARRHKYKRLNEIQSREQSAYSMQERKVQFISGHTDI